MRQNGIEAAIKQRSEEVPVFGICGGYQMLGFEIRDPAGVEEGGSIRGMELLPVLTVLQKEKKHCQTKGNINMLPGILYPISACAFEGYEIHMGDTLVKGNPLAYLSDGRKDGSYHKNIAGSYVHGFFDKKEIAGNIVKALFRKKGLEYGGAFIDRKAYKENQYDILADTVRENIDTELLFRILREGV